MERHVYAQFVTFLLPWFLLVERYFCEQPFWFCSVDSRKKSVLKIAGVTIVEDNSYFHSSLERAPVRIFTLFTTIYKRGLFKSGLVVTEVARVVAVDSRDATINAFSLVPVSRCCWSRRVAAGQQQITLITYFWYFSFYRFPIIKKWLMLLKLSLTNSKPSWEGDRLMNVYFTYQGKKVHLKLFPIIASEAVKSTEIGKQVHKIRRLRSLNSFRPQAAQAYYVRNNPNSFSSLLNLIIFALSLAVWPFSPRGLWNTYVHRSYGDVNIFKKNKASGKTSPTISAVNRMATIKGHKNLPYLYPMEAFQSVSMQFRRFPFPWVLHSPFLFSWRLEHVEFFYVSPCARLQGVLCLHCLGFNDVTPAIPRISCLVPVLNVRGHSIWRHVETTRNLPVCSVYLS